MNSTFYSQYYTKVWFFYLYKLNFYLKTYVSLSEENELLSFQL